MDLYSPLNSHGIPWSFYRPLKSLSNFEWAILLDHHCSCQSNLRVPKNAHLEPGKYPICKHLKWSGSLGVECKLYSSAEIKRENK